MKRGGVLAAVALALVALPASSAPAAVSTAPARWSGAAAVFVPGEVVVRYREGVGPAERTAVRARVAATGARWIGLARAELLRLPAAGDVVRAVAALRASSGVLWAEPNFVRRAAATTPDDPRFGRLWGLNNTGTTVGGVTGTLDADIDAPEAWDITTGSADVIVAVMDTGVAYDHPDLSANIWSNTAEVSGTVDFDDDGNGYVDDTRGWDFVGAGDNDPRDHNTVGHGTHVAGTIAARGNNSTGITGVSWVSKIMPLRVLDGNGIGTSATFAAAMSYAGAKGAKVLNGSLGTTPGSPPSLAERDAIAAAPGTLFVFAAGNDANDNEAAPVYPCGYGARFGRSNVICVAATTQNDTSAAFTNFGANTVDLAAPGVNIDSTQPALGSPVFSEDFETDISSRWTLRGTWERTKEASAGGLWSLTDSPSGASYANDSFTTATIASPLDLSGRQGCRIEYDLALQVEVDPFGDAVDLFGVEASTDGVSWAVMGVVRRNTSGFEPQAHSIERFDENPVVRVRFALETDSTIVDDGAHVDNVTVRCLSSTFAGTEFALLQGTSMASPHVAGAAALLFSQTPAATPLDVRRALLSNVDRIAGLDATTLSGGRLNIDKALRLETAADLIAPTTPALTGATLSARFQTSLSLPLSWIATDADSGVATYFVRYRRAKYNSTFGSRIDFRFGTRATSGTFTGVKGYTYCFSARARDRVGNYSAFSAERCTAFPVDDRAMSASSFTRGTGSGYYLNTFSSATAKGARLSLGSVRYKRLTLVAMKCASCGVVDVFQGSTLLKRVSLVSSSTLKKQLITIRALSGVTSAVTIQLRVASSGKLVRIDGLGINRV